MSFFCSSSSIMTSDFKSKSCFSGVLGHPGLAIVGELGSDAAILPRFLLVTFLHLTFAIFSSLTLVGLVVTGWCLNLL